MRGEQVCATPVAADEKLSDCKCGVLKFDHATQHQVRLPSVARGLVLEAMNDVSE